MDALHHLDDRLMLAVNTFARHTGWLHAVTLDYATYGVVLFGVLLVLGLLSTRHRPDRTLAAAGWACVATLVAVAVNQPIGSAIHEARPCATHPQLLTLAARPVTSPSPATTPSWPARQPPGCTWSDAGWVWSPWRWQC